MKKAFTMIELIFVIVVLGILASIAIPKFAMVKKNADVVSGRADVATIRAAIVSERQTQLVKGTNSYIPKLTPTGETDTLFQGDGTRTLLLYGISSGTGSGKWRKDGTDEMRYYYHVEGTDNTFDYNSTTGQFNCTSGNDCTGLSVQ